MQDLLFRPIGELAELIRAGELTAGELVSVSLQRIEALEPTINAFTYVAGDSALAEATAIADREQEICRNTEDFREGVAHFLEKRKPHFTGR